MPGNLAPFPWTPTNINSDGTLGNAGMNSPVAPGQKGPGWNVDQGDWCQVFVNYPDSNTTPVITTPGQFLIHVIYTPDSDDGVRRPDQTTTFGGAALGIAGSGAWRRRNYHIDPGFAFQAPWKGTVSVTAGGVSASTAQVELVLARGHVVRDEMAAQREIDGIKRAALAGNEQALEIVASGNPIRQYVYAPPLWAPPVVGTPQIVECTYTNPAGIPANTLIPIPDGAVAIQVVDQTGTPGSPITLSLITLGNTYRVDCAAGIPRSIAAFAHGAACTNGRRPTFQCALILGSVTIYSKLGG